MSCKFYCEGKDKLCRQELTKKHILSNDDSITNEIKKATTKKRIVHLWIWISPNKSNVKILKINLNLR